MKSSIYALGEIAEITMGQSPPSETYNTQKIGLPFFQGKAEFGEEHPTPVKWCSAPVRIAEAGDILLTVRAPVGPTNIASEKCCIGRGLASIRAKPEFALTRYLRFFFKYFEEEIASKGVGSTFTAINRNDISRLKITLPPLPEQERIVRLLDEADSLRATRERANARMEQFVPALFQEMFGDIETNSKKWKMVKLSNICEKCKTRNPSLKPEIEFIYIDIASVNGSKGIIESPKLIKGVDAPSRARQIIKTNDVLVSTVRPNLRATALVHSEYNDQIASTGFCVLRPESDIEGEYLYGITRNYWFTEQLVAKVRGANYPAVSDKDIFETTVPLPRLPSSVNLRLEWRKRVACSPRRCSPLSEWKRYIRVCSVRRLRESCDETRQVLS